MHNIKKTPHNKKHTEIKKPTQKNTPKKQVAGEENWKKVTEQVYIWISYYFV